MRTVCNEDLPVWQKQSDSQNCFKIRLTKLEFGLVKRVALVFVDPLHSEVSQSLNNLGLFALHCDLISFAIMLSLS